MTNPTEIDFALLPNLFIIGAAKSGTTTLHDILRQHPEIFMTEIKEPSFFSTASNYQKGLHWYQDTHFRDAKGFRLRGESSVNSLYWSTVAAARIHAAYGERKLKFISIFRDPVMRAWSYYWMHVHNGRETLSFEQALACEQERLTSKQDSLMAAGRGYFGYFRGGCYATLLQPFLELFPRQWFLFLLLEDLQTGFSDTMKNLVEFLEVDPGFTFRPIQSNPAGEPLSMGFKHFILQPSGAFHRLARIFTHRLPFPLRNRLRKGINQVNRRRTTNPLMSPETEMHLRLRYLDEIGNLEKIIGRDLSAWKTNPHPGSGIDAEQAA